MRRRLRRGRGFPRGTKGQTTWVNLANTTFFLGPFTADNKAPTFPGFCASNGFNLIGQAELEDYERDLTILRIVGDIHYALSAVEGGQIDAAGYCVQFGLYTQHTAAQSQGVPVIGSDIDNELSWMTTRKLYVPVVDFPVAGVLRSSLGTDWANWNQAQSHIDLTVKRKLGTLGALDLFESWHGLLAAIDAVSVIQFSVCVHLRALILH